jgi:hypothetical protein
MGSIDVETASDSSRGWTFLPFTSGPGVDHGVNIEHSDLLVPLTMSSKGVIDPF